MVILLVILICILLGAIFYLIVVENDKRNKRKAEELAQTNKELEAKLEKMSIELLARRNQLPWINVEEFDGPQE